MKKLVVCFAAALLLAGCQSTSSVPQETAETRAADALSRQRVAECKAQPHRTMTSLQRCLNDAMAIADSTTPGTGDIMQLHRAQMLIAAEQYDKKKITASQYELLKAQITNQSLNAVDRRLTSMYGGKPTRYGY